MTSKSTGKSNRRLPSKLKSKILAEILSPNSFIPKIAKKYNVSSTTLYGWRIDHNKKLNQNLESQRSVPENNFIELLPEESDKSSLLSPSISKSKLSEISLTLGSVSLSIKGSVGTSSLIKILDALEESC